MSSLKSTAHQMGWLYAAIVLIFLAITTTFQIEHPEWGLVTTAILFGPSQRQTVRKALFRFGATAIAGVLVILINALAPSQAVAAILVIGVLITGHLAIHFPDWAYYYFVFGVTLGILSVQAPTTDSVESISVTVHQRLVQIGLATMVTVPILLVYLRLKTQQPEDHQPPHTLAHSEFLICAAFSAPILYGLGLLIPDTIFVLVYLLTIIFLSASAVIRNLAAIAKFASVGALAAIAFVLITRWLWLLIPDVSIYKILVVSILFGAIKTCSLSSKSWSMAWELVLIFGSIMLAIEVSSDSPTSTYLVILFCFLTSMGIITICQTAGKLTAKRFSGPRSPSQ